MTVAWPVPGPPRDAFADAPAPHPFAAAIARAWQGAQALASLVDEARALGLDGPLPPGRPPAAAPRLPSDADLARIAADHDPAIGASAPDLVLGPWADEADRRSLLAAVVHGAFVRDAGEPGPLARHLRADRKQGADPALRHLLEVPLAPWTRDGAPLLPIGAVPDGPVRLRPIACPAGDGPVVFARVVRGPDGWEAIAPVAVPRLPDAVPAWLRLLAWEERLLAPCASLDELLARRGHALLRRCLEDVW